MNILSEISLEVKKATKVKEQPLVKLAALSASVELVQRTFDLTCTVILGGVLVQVFIWVLLMFFFVDTSFRNENLFF